MFPETRTQALYFAGAMHLVSDQAKCEASHEAAYVIQTSNVSLQMIHNGKSDLRSKHCILQGNT